MPTNEKTPGIYDVEKRGFEPPKTTPHIHVAKEVHHRGSVRLMCDCGHWMGDKPLPCTP